MTKIETFGGLQTGEVSSDPLLPSAIFNNLPPDSPKDPQVSKISASDNDAMPTADPVPPESSDSDGGAESAPTAGSEKILAVLRQFMNSQGASSVAIVSEASGITQERILDIYRTGRIEADETESLRSFLKKEIAAENEAVEKFEGFLSKVKNPPSSVAKNKKTKNTAGKIKFPTRSGIRRLFVSHRFKSLRRDEIAFFYANPENDLRLVCETGCFPRPQNPSAADNSANVSDFTVKGNLKFYILDTRTNRRITKLTREYDWETVEGSVSGFLMEKIADFLVEVNYRPFCQVHRKFYDLTVPSGDDSRQFWSCTECYETDKKRRSTENIRVNLTSERYYQTVDNLQAQIHNLRTKKDRVREAGGSGGES